MVGIDVMERLVKANDAISELDDALYDIFCVSLAETRFTDATFVQEIIIELSHPYWKEDSIENEDALNELLNNRSIPVEERARALLREGENFKFEI